MLLNEKSVLALTLLVVGCVSSQVSMRIDGANSNWRSATTRLKYHITSMRMRNPGTERMLKEAGGVNATMLSGYEYTQGQIRKMERQMPTVFDQDGVPVDIDIETATDSKMSPWQYPYYFLCGCSLCILPFYKGTAKKSYWFWIFNHESPDSFAHEIMGSFNGLMIPTVYNAAVYDACDKSGASIILAPRFTETTTTSFLWFSGEKTVTVEGVPARITGAEEIPVEKWPEIFGSQSGTQKVITVPAK